MNKTGLYILTLLFLLFLISCKSNQIVSGKYLGIKDSRSILKHEMSDSLFQITEGRKVKRSDRVIKKRKEVKELAKPVFLEKYEDYGVEGRGYTIHLINGFWIVKGLLPRGLAGGTLVAVFDAESGKLYSSLVWK